MVMVPDDFQGEGTVAELNYAEIFKGEDGQWYFRIKALNGEIVATGEGYVEKSSTRERVKQLFEGIEIRELDTIEEVTERSTVSTEMPVINPEDVIEE